jgi:hypothetical protein
MDEAIRADRRSTLYRLVGRILSEAVCERAHVDELDAEALFDLAVTKARA